MRKNYTKILAYSLSLALAFGCLSYASVTSSTVANAETVTNDPDDGDIVENPWNDLLNPTTNPGDLPSIGNDETSSNNGSTTDKNNDGNKDKNKPSITTKKAKIKKVKRISKKKARIKIKKIKGSTGYQIQYSTKRKFKKKKTKNNYNK